ncbi:hypothetical protein [Flavobacterium davisii]|uniref:hypothetical protein n=1 Tax=Flavobacterium davisii TaxID=2906077 RepID=UPI0035CEF2DB
MTSQIQNAINEYQNIQGLDDLELFYNYNIKHKVLYEKSIKEFAKICTICNKENNLDSYCYCKFFFSNGNSVEFVNRSDIKGFIIAYNEIEKKLHQYDDNLTNEEKYVLSQGSIFDPIDIKNEDDSESIVIGNETDDDVVLSDEDLKLFESNFKDNQNTENPKQVIESKELKFFKDIFFPIFTYLCLIQFPLVIFISTFLIYNGDFNKVVEEGVLGNSGGLFSTGLILIIAGVTKELKYPLLQVLFSKKSIKNHILVSIILLAFSMYQIILGFIAMVLLFAFIAYLWKYGNVLIDKIKKLLS